MRILLIVLVLVFLGLQYKLWVGEGSVIQWLHLEKKLASQTEENNKRSVRNEAIVADIAELKSGDQALEERARFELGMVKEGEEYYQFVN